MARVLSPPSLRPYSYATVLQRTGNDDEIELSVTVTPLAAIARLEHVLAGVEEEQRHCRQRLEDAEWRLSSYRSRTGCAFAFAEELADKRRQLRLVDDALAEVALHVDEDPTSEI